MTEFRIAAAFEDVPDNGSLAVELDGVDVLLCKAEGEIFAVQNRCSHQSQPLTHGRVRRGYVSCPLHGMRFRLTDGAPVGQMTNVPLAVYETRVEQGQIHVRIQ